MRAVECLLCRTGIGIGEVKRCSIVESQNYAAYRDKSASMEVQRVTQRNICAAAQ